jgi:hypothetical protein
MAEPVRLDRRTSAMLIMDVQIWIAHNFASDPHGIVERAALDLLSAPLRIPLVCCHIKSFRRASSCSEAMARRRKEERQAGLASRDM